MIKITSMIMNFVLAAKALVEDLGILGTLNFRSL